MSEWQPIESAPKDGSYMLLYFPEGARSLREDYDAQDWSEYEPAMMLGFWSGDNYPENEWTHDFYEGISFYGEPTHWMPLPTPPTE